MQTAKNIYLNRDKNLSRKAQEALLAWNLEDKLPKDAILEIYLNIAQFGPSLFGIKDASSYYFGKTLDKINLREAVFLASLLPSPDKRHRQYCRESLTRNYDSMLKNRLETMHKINLITEQEFKTTLNEPLVFSRINRARTTRCTKNVASKKNQRRSDTL